jgi:hypothetical protein
MNNKLHLYQQNRHGDEAFIIGNKTGLLYLKDVLIFLLHEETTQTSAIVNFYDSSNKEYELVIGLRDDEELKKLNLPFIYTDQVFYEQEQEYNNKIYSFYLGEEE